MCSHVFAVLEALSSQVVQGEQSVTSLPCKSGPRRRSIQPQPIMKVVVEKSTPADDLKGKPLACFLRDNRGKGKRNMSQEKVEALRASFADHWPMKSLFPKRFNMVTTQFGEVPQGSGLSYHLAAAVADSSHPQANTNQSKLGALPPLPFPPSKPV